MLGAELLVKLGKLSLPGGDLSEAQTLARAASQDIGDGHFGYAITTAWKSRGNRAT